MDDDAFGATPPSDTPASKLASASHPVNRALPFRIYIESEAGGIVSQSPSNGRTRRKSRYPLSHLNRSSEWQAAREYTKFANGNGLHVGHEHIARFAGPKHAERTNASSIQRLASNPTPPMTPTMNGETASLGDNQYKILEFDFSRIDYELDRTRKTIDTGIWSTVYFAKPVARSSKPNVDTNPPSPVTPSRGSTDPPSILYVVKMPKGAGAKKVFDQEAKILTKLQQSEDCHEYIVPFYGVDERTSALVFEGVGGGPPEDPSLEGFVTRFSTMTEHERYKAFRELFVRAAYDLVGGLKFIHAHGIIHADIKPANVLLDIRHKDSAQMCITGARYIDFSASFCTGSDSSHAGGTWDYLAPEQIYAYKEAPTFASDVWSLGITLLFILVGRSPYAETCGIDAFRSTVEIQRYGVTPTQSAAGN